MVLRSKTEGNEVPRMNNMVLRSKTEGNEVPRMNILHEYLV